MMHVSFLCDVRRIFALISLVGALSGMALGQIRFDGPQSGDVYREYSRTMRTSDNEWWRVTDPNINTSVYPAAIPFLPNPQVPLTISDLAGAVRAEAVITMWGGHISTYGRKVRFNGNSWIDIPDLDGSNGIPAGHQGYNYIHQSMVTVPVPLGNLFEGGNYFEGTNAGQVGGPVGYGFGWGQHGWYAVMIRVYYSDSKAHPTGTITSPANSGTMNESPSIAVSVQGSADRVDVLAYYDGYDTDGDGVYSEYHYDYHVTGSETDMAIRNHVGTSTSSPFSVQWNTQWVPDQTAGSVKLMARIRGSSGVWYVTPEVTNLSLARTGRSVKLYKPFDTPERAWARGDLDVVRVDVNIPAGHNLGDATAAVYHNRTWNGIDGVREPGETNYRRFNGWTDGEYGANHYFAYDVRSAPTGELRTGNNQFSFFSQTVLHHGIEIIWPGPALVVEYTGSGYVSPVPPAAALASPLNNATNQPPTLTLSWQPAAAASSYDLQVSTDSTFAITTVNLTGLASTSSQVGPLANVTRFFWRVRGKNAAGTGDWSPVWAFNTFVSAPTLKTPANNATAQPVSVLLVWRSVATSTAYRVQLAKDSVFSGGEVVKDTTLADTTKSVSGLLYGTRYFWRVSAQTGGSWGNFSAAWAFNTIAAPAAVPVQAAPANNSIDLPVSTTVRWRTAANASSYHAQVATDSTFAGGFVANDSTLTDTTRAVSGLSYDRKYFWRVRSKNAAGFSAFSGTWNFRTVMSVANAPSLLAPANGTAGQPVTGLTFQWRPLAGATTYRFQLATDSTFVTGIIKNDSTVTDTFRLVSGLTISTRYFWRVTGKNAGGTGPVSPTWSFTTVVPVPGAVSLVGPGNLTQVSADSARFTWQKPTPAATRYWFQISADSTFGLFSSTDSTIADTAKVFRPLLTNTTYYWRVRGGNAGGWGAYSEVRGFTVLIAGIDREEGVPTQLTLKQNYPNPFNPATQISFGLPGETRVLLEVYNLLGQRVATLLNERRSAGYHSVRFDAAGLPSGLYLYRLTAGETSLFKKMLFVK